MDTRTCCFFNVLLTQGHAPLVYRHASATADATADAWAYRDCGCMGVPPNDHIGKHQVGDHAADCMGAPRLRIAWAYRPMIVLENIRLATTLRIAWAYRDCGSYCHFCGSELTVYSYNCFFDLLLPYIASAAVLLPHLVFEINDVSAVATPAHCPRLRLPTAHRAHASIVRMPCRRNKFEPNNCGAYHNNWVISFIITTTNDRRLYE